MKIKAIVAENFLSYRELTYRYPDRGLHFIAGRNYDSLIANSNRAGKSAFTEALCWGLFGKTIRNCDTDDIVNWDIKKDCVVYVIIEDDKGNEFEISRFRNHTKDENNLYLMRDLEELTGSKVSETQEKIDKILGMSWSVFTSAVIFGERAQRFADARESEKKEIFDEILLSHLDFAEAQKKVKIDLKELDSSIVTFHQEIEHTEAIEDTYLLEVVRLKEEKLELENREEEQVVVVKEIEKRIEKYRVVIEKTEAGAREAKEKHDDLYKLALKVETLYEEVQEKIEKGSKNLRKQQTDASKNLTTAQINVNSFKERLSEYNGIKGKGKCPTCLQPTLKAIDLNKQITLYEEKLISEKELVENFQQIYNVLLKDEAAKEKKWSQEMDGIIESKEMHEEGIKKHQNTINEAQREVQNLTFKINLDQKEIENRTASYKKELERVSTDIARKTNQLEAYAQKKAEIKNEIKKFEEKKEYFEFWVMGFGNQGLKSFLIDTVIPELNNQVNYYASALMDDTIQINFDTETKLKSGEMRDKFNIRIRVNGQEVPYKNYSSGEKGRIDTAILLAMQNLIFNRNVDKSNLIIFDEIFEHLDIIGIERTVNLLKEEAKDKAIYVISHQTEFSDYFDNVIMIENKNGVSTLKVE